MHQKMFQKIISVNAYIKITGVKVYNSFVCLGEIPERLTSNHFHSLRFIKSLQHKVVDEIVTLCYYITDLNVAMQCHIMAALPGCQTILR